MNLSLSRNARPELRVSQAHQQSAWASGDYAVVGNALQIVSEELCDSVNLCQEQRVLDVAAGNFHAALAAARRWCDVTATDVPSDLTRRSRQRIEAESVGVRFADGDAEALPFGDQSFDAVMSSFGAMFAVDQERAASEMVRVCRRGHRIGLANWTPDGFVGQLFDLLARFAPAGGAAGRASCAWGTRERLQELFGVYGHVDSDVKNVAFRARTPMDWVDKLRATYAPVLRAFAVLDADGKRDLRAQMLSLVSEFNRAKDSSMVVDAQYLEVVVLRR
ncbi:MAG TPA: methyltransferase domain-containing protein [Steroidobacteraceae bacterium]|nr:methyltransferase domain-containing protein [Steroidobacteraceae bacterium]